MKQVNCATYEGIEAKVVQVESTLTKGLPSFSIVGIASTSINESKERVNNQRRLDFFKDNYTLAFMRSKSELF
ncbi:hypothetical protein KKA17_01060 [bacterium]|nr:hypothetical protein [bacterium]MBU1882889.1 hypothetical protein [bacterium]